MIKIDYSKYYWKNDVITLRQPIESDWEHSIQNMFNSENRVLFQAEIELPTDVEKYRKEFIENYDNEVDYIRFVIENSEGRYVGAANLFGIDERHGNFGPIGIQINESERGKGYGAAVYRMLGMYMFNERRMHKWNSEYVENNLASAALHKKIGFEIEGVRKDTMFINGKYHNEIFVGITAEQFFKHNK